MRFKSRSRALASAALAATLGFAGLGLVAPAAQASEPTEATRIEGLPTYEGGTRYETAAEAATTAYPDGAANVVLASGEKFPDALAGAGLAGQLDAPILLTLDDMLPESTIEALAALDPTTVTILGESDAVSDAVEAELVALGYTVDRIGGEHRFETARLIAAELDGDTAVLANGLKFPDALAISPGGHELELPLLLTTADTLDADAAAALADDAIENVIIVGETDVVSQAIQDQLEADGLSVTRLGGDTRFETAIEIAEFHTTVGFTLDEVVLARSDKFPDALAGGPLAAQMMAPMVLTQSDSLTSQTGTWLASNCEAIDALTIMGGPVAIANPVVAAAQAAAQCEDTIGPNETFTDAPELVQVTNVETDVVAFEFDETITGQALKFTGTSPNRQYYSFRLYNPQGEVAYPLEARIEGDSVIARFAPNVVNRASLATVRYDAVEDATGTPNIEGEFPLLPPVVTSATAPFSPQLVRVDNYRTAQVITGGTAELLIDYTFNAAGAGATLGLLDGNPPSLLNPAGDDANDFYLVGQFGAEFQADSIQNVQTTPAVVGEDPGQTVITVSFSVNPSDVPESQLRRGYVVADGTAPDTDNEEAESPDDGDGNGIVLSEAFEGGDDITDVPDLENVTRTNATTYRFQFDEAVSDTFLDASRFFVFDAAGNETSATSVARSAVAADEASVVVATFVTLPTTGAGTPVDAFVADGAVRATDSTDDENNGFNRPDEVILTLPATGETQPPAGITAKPDLLSITRDQNVVTENFSVTFTFDQALPANLANVAFDLYDDNGVQFRVAGTACGSPGVQCATNSITFSIDNSFGGLSNEQIDAAVTGGVEDLDDTDELSGNITVTEAQTPITDA